MIVIKVGGSLFDLPQLGNGLRRLIALHAGKRVLLVPGGGQLADVIREYHALHGLTEVVSHRLGIQTMTLHAELLSQLVPELVLCQHPHEVVDAPAVIDADSFCRWDESHGSPLEHTWNVTSDSIAARIAEVASADRLILLKSRDADLPYRWSALAEEGAIDPVFPKLMDGATFQVQWINFRRWVREG